MQVMKLSNAQRYLINAMITVITIIIINCSKNSYTLITNNQVPILTVAIRGLFVLVMNKLSLVLCQR
ncbi:hypothetical protein T12_16713 [Trichinella patagoniensis]|uniref:Uncharacterized protein n=1 Tax=Trichinella patagoniensis TaxID=990121 RepID=A0A0V0ZUM5_9BILA|nr:hypothetical protein T12_16713 [Trichinella patagoniensis]